MKRGINRIIHTIYAKKSTDYAIFLHKGILMLGLRQVKRNINAESYSETVK